MPKKKIEERTFDELMNELIKVAKNIGRNEERGIKPSVIARYEVRLAELRIEITRRWKDSVSKNEIRGIIGQLKELADKKEVEAAKPKLKGEAR